MQQNESKSVSEFHANIHEHLKHLQSSGTTEVLTHNGEAEGIVMSPETYQRLLDDAEIGRNIRLIRQSIHEHDAGQGIPADIVFDQLRHRANDESAR